MTVLKETATLTPKSGGRAKIGIITPGVGSSGTYPKETIEAAARDKVFGQGLHMYLDHATEAQDWERPEGSLRDLVGVLTEDAHWDDEVGGLVAEAKIYSHWRPVIEEMKDDIGVSIRASGEVREDAGKRIVTRLTEARSVDFVTRAGRGGRLLEFIESARFNEATADEIRRLLQDAVKAAHGAENTWVWLRDYDETHVWFDLDTDESNKTLEQTYTRDGVNISLTGTAMEVVATTTFIPKTTPAPAGNGTNQTATQEEATMADTNTSTSRVNEADSPEVAALKKQIADLKAELAAAKKGKGSATNTKESQMPEIQESRLRELEEAAGRATAMESKLTEAETENAELKTKLKLAEAKDYARDFAIKLVHDANSELSEAAVQRIVGEALPKIQLAEDGRLDTENLTAQVTKARESEENYLARIAEESGLGRVRGIGHTEPNEITEATADSAVASLFGREVKGA